MPSSKVSSTMPKSTQHSQTSGVEMFPLWLTADVVERSLSLVLMRVISAETLTFADPSLLWNIPARA